MKIYIGCDHGAYKQKEEVLRFVKKFGEVFDQGTFSEESCDYPLYAEKVARIVAKENNEKVKGILLCGSGIGVSIVANRFKNIRAALCRSSGEVKLAREHNNANILCLGGRISDLQDILNMCETFFTTSFEEGRHSNRIKIFNEWGEEA